MFRLTWIPNWVAIKSFVCARYDCNELRELGRRWCEGHAAEWDREAVQQGGAVVLPFRSE